MRDRVQRRERAASLGRAQGGPVDAGRTCGAPRTGVMRNAKDLVHVITRTQPDGLERSIQRERTRSAEARSNDPHRRRRVRARLAVLSTNAPASARRAFTLSL